MRSRQSLGFVLLDVLIALLIFSMGFAVLYGLTENALAEVQQATNLMQAANIAQKHLDQLANHSWEENIVQGSCVPGSVLEGDEGRFHWLLRADWDTFTNLLRVNIKIRWLEQGKSRNYYLESLYHVD